MACNVQPARHRFCDVHTHLIPGVDDGSESMDMSHIMLLSAYDQGARAVFATSHSSAYDSDPEAPRSRFLTFQNQAGRYLKDLRLYLGCEIYCEASRMTEVLDALKTGRYPTMNGTDYVLMEFSQWVQPQRAASCVGALTDAGWRPIVAHMERYPYLQGREETLMELESMGALLQVNAYSLLDEKNTAARSWAQRLVLDHRISFLGTDAHRTYHRPPSASSGLEWLYSHTDRRYADAVTWGNASAYLM